MKRLNCAVFVVMSFASLLEPENGPSLFLLFSGRHSGTLSVFDLERSGDDSNDVTGSNSKMI